MKIKVAYGDFDNHSGGTSICGPGTTRITDSGKDALFSITNRCRVHGVFLFNIESSEKIVQLKDIASGTYAEMVAAPKVYETIVPRDQSFSKTWTIGGDFGWSSTISMDMYDTPTGIYDTFPKPGFLFEKGVAVHNATAGADAKLHWLILYSE